MRTASTVLGAAVLAAYPLLVYLGLTRLSVRGVGLLLLLVVLPPHLVRAMRKGSREHLKAVLPLPAGIGALLLAAVAIEDHRFILALPVLINAFLLATFAASLGRPISMIERFARMQVDTLSAAEIAHCRAATVAWCVLFVVNGAVTAVLALRGPLSFWTAYAGGISYVLVGLLFAAEYVVRKARFRRYGSGLQDKLFARIFPPRRGG